MDKNNFVDNKEIFNQRLFDRNQLDSRLAANVNNNPVYFNEQYKSNRMDSESLFEKRFSNIHQITQQPKHGIVNFTVETNHKDVNFKKNYKDYI